MKTKVIFIKTLVLCVVFFTVMSCGKPKSEFVDNDKEPITQPDKEMNVDPCATTTNSQIIPCIKSAVLTEHDKAILNQYLSKYTAFTFNKKELADYLHANGDAGRLRLRIDDRLDWTIDLELNDLRAPGYTSTYTTDEGTFEVEEPFVVNTFKGKTSDGKTVRFTIDEDFFFGVIFGERYHYMIRPAKDYTKNSEDETIIVYHSWDVISL